MIRRQFTKQMLPTAVQTVGLQSQEGDLCSGRGAGTFSGCEAVVLGAKVCKLLLVVQIVLQTEGGSHKCLRR